VQRYNILTNPPNIRDFCLISEDFCFYCNKDGEDLKDWAIRCIGTKIFKNPTEISFR
jgi:hypothetical protein